MNFHDVLRGAKPTPPPAPEKFWSIVGPIEPETPPEPPENPKTDVRMEGNYVAPTSPSKQGFTILGISFRGERNDLRLRNVKLPGEYPAGARFRVQIEYLGTGKSKR